MERMSRAVLDLCWRGVIAGIGYTAASFVVGDLLKFISTAPNASGKGQSPAVYLLATTLMSIAVGAAARRTPASRPRHLVIWTSLVFFNIVSITIEGTFFSPGLAPAIPTIVMQSLFGSAVMAAIVMWLFAPRQEAPNAIFRPRSWFSWVWRFLLSSFSYLVFYFVFGAINYALVTKPYYDSQVGGITVPEPQVVLLAESVRAPLIALSVLPYLLTAKVSRRQKAIVTGLLLFVVGGVVPLLWQAENLPALLLIASAWEIFFQNMLTGMVASYLLGRKMARDEELAQAAC